MRRKLALARIEQFMLAGNAHLTIENSDTGKRFTYRIRKPGDDKPHFVSVLTGPDNGSSYTFLGTIFDGATYYRGRRSTISEDATSAKEFAWFWRAIKNGSLPASVHVWHEGRCGRCARRVTVPASVASGFGPECAIRMAA